MTDVADRVAIVTGAGTGIGRAVVQDLVAHGAFVMALGRTRSTLEETIATLDDPDRARLCVGDISDPQFAEAAVAETLEAFGRIDHLCNNAGMHELTWAHELDVATWDQVLGTNLTGPFLLSRSALPHMMEQGGGAIVNVASIASTMAGAGGVAYTASKHGVIGLTRQLAMQYGPHGIRVNCICPGQVGTEMLETAVAADATLAAFVNEFSGKLPVGRRAEPVEMARVIRFLLSDDASYVTGAAWYVDGGYTLGHFRPPPKSKHAVD